MKHHKPLVRKPLIYGSLVLLAASAGANSGGRLPLPHADFANAADHLRQAHEAFLAKDPAHMTLSLKEALMADPQSPAIARNAAQLIHHHYAAHPGEALPVDWQLPVGISYFKIAVRRMQFSEAGYRVQVNFDAPNEESIEEFKLIRYPEETIVDLRGHVAESSVEKENDGSVSFWFGTEYREEAPPEGLYLIELKVNGEWTKGWVILSNLATSTAPRVISPRSGESVRTPQPTFDFADYYSPEHRPGQTRKLYLTVRPRGDENDKWTATIDDPHLNQVTLGQGVGRGTGLNQLESGAYRLQLIFEERERFGPITVARQSGSAVPFFVEQP